MQDTKKISWLQVKGDPAIRELVFQQTRVESIFDQKMDEILTIVEELLCKRGVFHIRIHFSSNQLTCWTYENPYSYEVYVGDEIFEPSFMDNFTVSKSSLPPKIIADSIKPILEEFRGLRFLDETIYLRSASINRINGIISLSFSCDGTHYIDHEDFFETSHHFDR
ncbi:MAG: hypothetical protein IEMM0008_0640 [bacterium]|nr:MAG: hypothetical protein IEMM0008_0640 [bacterium]